MLKEMDLVLARRVLCARLQRYLDGLDPVLRADVYTAFAQEGKLLHQPATDLDGRWALVPFCLAWDLSVGCASDLVEEAACDIALAMECVVSATDLLDDVMDDDATPLLEQLGIARALNVALALISLSQRLLLALLDLDLPVALPTRLMNMMQRAILQASTGQQQDLLAERRLAYELTQAECLAIAAAKAGALLGLACQMGAVCAGVGEEQIEGCAEVGRLLGIAAQLDNDAHDLSALLQSAESERERKSDLVRGKKTLPIVLAARLLKITCTLDASEIDFRHMEWLTREERERYGNALREGIVTTWGIALLYRARAGERLSELMGKRAVSATLSRVLGLDSAFAEAYHQ